MTAPTIGTIAAGVIDDVHAISEHAAEIILGLQVTAARLAKERDEERRRADLAEAAGVDLVRVIGYGIRLEEQLQAGLREARAKARTFERVSVEQRIALDAKERELRRVASLLLNAVGENEQLRTELDAEPRRGWRFIRIQRSP